MTSRPSTQGSVRLPPIPQIKHPLEARVGSLPAINAHAVNRNTPSAGSSTKPNLVDRAYTPRGAAADAVHKHVLSPYVGERGYCEIDVRPRDGGQYIVTVRERTRPNTQASSSLERVTYKNQIDETEMAIKLKCKQSQTEVQKKFIDNDPKALGEISRDGLLRVLITLTGKQISRPMFNHLLVRLGLENKTTFHYRDLIVGTKLQSGTVESYPSWMDRSGHKMNHGAQSTLTSEQVHELLKARSQTRKQDLFGIIPVMAHGPHKILKTEFRTAITNLLQVNMTDEEFDSLWKMYDREGKGAVDGRIITAKWGLSAEDEDVSENDADLEDTKQSTSNLLRRKEANRQRSITVERWLRNQLRQGYHHLRKSFAKYDSQLHGQVPAKEFCDILAENGLQLHPDHLDEFLSRCGIVQTSNGVPYKEFLEKFQDRSNGGVTQQILQNQEHRYHRRAEDNQSETQLSTMSAIEAELLDIFQKEYLTLLDKFRTLDKYNMEVISQEEFRNAIESCFDLKLSDEQFRSLLELIPLTKHREVRYLDVLAQFNTKDGADSLASGPLPEDIQLSDLALTPRRNVTQTFDLIRQLLTDRFEDVEKEYANLEYYSSQTLTQEALIMLLRKFITSPPLTRGEVRELWQTLFTKKDTSLTWQQFISQFGFTGQTHTYVDAGKNPPKYGDSDCNVKSNKLNSDYNLLLDTTRQKIDYRWEDLRRSFRNWDPSKTGCLSQSTFKDIVNEYCTQLSIHDLSEIMQRYQATDNRVNYVAFLADFSPNRKVWQSGNDMFNLLKHAQTPLNLSSIVEDPQMGLIGLSAKLRNKLSGSWKNLRRAFQKLDSDSSGYLALPEFRNVLQLANIVLDEDEVYHIMSTLDEDLTGKLDYNSFLSQLVRPDSQQSSRNCSRNRSRNRSRNSSRIGSRMSGLMPLSRLSLKRPGSIAE